MNSVESQREDNIISKDGQILIRAMFLVSTISFSYIWVWLYFKRKYLSSLLSLFSFLPQLFTETLMFNMYHVCAKLKVTYAYKRVSASLIVQKYLVSTGSIEEQNTDKQTPPPQSPSSLRNNNQWTDITWIYK